MLEKFLLITMEEVGNLNSLRISKHGFQILFVWMEVRYVYLDL